MGNQNSHPDDEQHSQLTVPDAKNQVEQYIAEPTSDEGQAVIEGPETHVTEVWEDGELTTTKSGDLYRRRNLHRLSPPIVENAELLFEVQEGEHRRMIVTDREGLRSLLSDLRQTILGDDG